MKRIDNPRAVMGNLMSLREKQADCYVWRFVGDRKLLAGVTFEAVRKIKGELDFRVKSGDEAIFREVIGACDYVNIWIPSAATLFRASVKEFNQGMIVCRPPKFLAQVERRKHLRLETYEINSIQAVFCKSMVVPKLQTQFFTKSLWDISAGGLSFLVSRVELKFFNTDETVAPIEIKIDGMKVKVEAKILAVKEVQPSADNGLLYKVWRVSLSFDKIDKKDQEIINKYIFQNIQEDLTAV